MIVGFRCDTCAARISWFKVEVRPPDHVVLEATCARRKIIYHFEITFANLRAIGEGKEVKLFGVNPDAELLM